MSLTEQQRRFYEYTLQVAKQEMEDLDRLIEEELAKVKDRLAELQNAKKASRQMYDAACMRLGVPHDMEAEEARDSDWARLHGLVPQSQDAQADPRGPPAQHGS